MNHSFVADSSVALAWILQNQATDATRSLLLEIREGASVVVPSLWFFEVANALVIATRRKLISAADRQAATAFYAGLRLESDDGGSERAMSATSDLALQYGLTVYDAAYLELARRRALPLATRDATLQAAAKKCKVELL